jgi:hypothetical protein
VLRNFADAAAKIPCARFLHRKNGSGPRGLCAPGRDILCSRCRTRQF